MVRPSERDHCVSTVEERSYVEVARREKRAALEALGVPAFAYRYERTHSAAGALAAYRDEMGENGPEVSIAGRIESWRPKGESRLRPRGGLQRTNSGVPETRRSG